jgi:hypothetical protein
VHFDTVLSISTDVYCTAFLASKSCNPLIFYSLYCIIGDTSRVAREFLVKLIKNGMQYEIHFYNMQQNVFVDLDKKY